jgi:CRISPR-associated protein Cmr6
MSAAQPAYLKDTSDAAPGHHFGLYYAGWNPDFSKLKAGTSDVLRSTVCKLPKHSRDLLTALVARQNAEALTLTAQIFTYPTIASAPFATGLGNEHPLENGFSFLTPYGLPYLPGSGVKGVIRKAAEELLSGDWNDDTQGWSADAIRALFGPGEEDETRDSNPLQGALRFWDVIPTPPAAIKNDKALLTVEIMTPHHSGYYQDCKTPNTSESPTPISFLAVAAEARFTFHVECNPARLNPELQANWRLLVEAAFAHAGKWLGFGAKTAVGYGRMALDPKVAEQRATDNTKLAERKAKEAEQTRVATLPPEQRLLADLKTKLSNLPKDPRDGKEILQATTHHLWSEIMSVLDTSAPALAGLDKPVRENLASEIKKHLCAGFKVEGKAEKAMKACLAAIRGQ